MLVCSDIDNCAVEFDTGKKRSLADSYKLKLGRMDSMLTTGSGCAFIRQCYLLDKVVSEGFVNNNVWHKRVSFAEIDEFVKALDEIL